MKMRYQLFDITLALSRLNERFPEKIAGMSQREIARALGMHETDYSRRVNGKLKSYSRDNLYAACHFYGVSMNDLYEMGNAETGGGEPPTPEDVNGQANYEEDEGQARTIIGKSTVFTTNPDIMFDTPAEKPLRKHRPSTKAIPRLPVLVSSKSRGGRNGSFRDGGVHDKRQSQAHDRAREAQVAA